MSLIIYLLLTIVISSGTCVKYDPNWDSLDKRPLPSWYDEAKFGIFLHWGVYSVPSFGSEWFWHHWQVSQIPQYREFMFNNYKPTFTYQDFGPGFSAEFFDPKHWSNIFASSGAKYVVLTSKHHEGFTLWPSKHSYSWNAMDIGPQKDLVGTLANAVRKAGVRFGVYYSLFEWFNPLWLSDKASNLTNDFYVKNKMIPELMDLINTYQPDVLWSDGSGEAPDTYWKSCEFLAWLYNESPVKDKIVTNDRWGSNTDCKHGGFYSCRDRYNPGYLLPHKWENAMTIDKHSWGFRREARLNDYLTLHELITELVSTVSCGGNLLVNVGPSHDGTISPIFEERLRGLGKWLHVNGEAIYNTHPWTFQNETVQTGLWYTKRKNYVYALMLEWPFDGILTLYRPQIADGNTVTLLGFDQKIQWVKMENGVNVSVPDTTMNSLPLVFKFSKVIN